MSTSRLRRFLRFAIISLGLVMLFYFLLSHAQERWVEIPDLKANSIRWRLSMSLAWTAVLFIVTTLSIGPLNILRRRSNPIHNVVRRDLGIWTAIIALSHMTIGMLVHTDGLQVWWLFIEEWPTLSNPLPLHYNVFGVANYAGLFQALVLIFLLAISNNNAMRRLGIQRWKNLQRLTYAAFASIVTHAFAYQTLENRDVILRIFFGMMIMVAVGLQLAGFVKQRHKGIQKNTLAEAASLETGQERT
jgi:sulfoxide reductase heme-binding subunit YedZ